MNESRRSFLKNAGRTALGIGSGLPLLAAGCGGRAAPVDLSDQNLLLITIDTLRADRLGFSGYTAAETPNRQRNSASLSSREAMRLNSRVTR